MNKIYQIIILFILIMSVPFFSLHGNAVLQMQTMPKDDMLIFPTYNDKFILTDISSSGYEVYQIDSKNNLTLSEKENIKINFTFTSGKSLFLCSEYDGFLVIYKLSGKTQIYSIPDIQLKNNHCAAYGNQSYIYCIDKRKSDTVCKYSTDGSLDDTFSFSGKNIYSLFSTDEDGEVFAVTDKGIIDIEENRFITCSLPSEPYYFNDRYVYDNKGCIFKFSENNGFQKIIDTEYSSVCTDLNGTVFASDGKYIYILDNNGNAVSYCNVGNNVDKIYSSGYSVMTVCGKKISILSKNNFEKIAEIPSSAYQNENSVYVSQPKMTSYADTYNNSKISAYSQNLNYSVNTDTYSISGGYIKDIPADTTIAQLKKNIDFGDFQLEVINHNGKTVTSGKVGTGWKIRFLGNNADIEYLTVIKGDLTGEGNINSRDISAMSSILCGGKELSEAYILASDINSDGIFGIEDMYLLQKMIS